VSFFAVVLGTTALISHAQFAVLYTDYQQRLPDAINKKDSS
jgi:hypothetical protein